MKKISIIIIPLFFIFTNCQHIPSLSNNYKSADDSDFLRYVSQGKVAAFFGAAYDVYVSKKYAYVTHNNGVRIFDISNVQNIDKLGNIPTEEAAFSCQVTGNIAFVVGMTGLIIADITDPKDPEIIGHYYENGILQRVDVHGDIAYVANRDKGLEIIDISDLKNPKRINGKYIGGCGSAYKHGEILLAAIPSKGLAVFDASVPADPVFIEIVAGTQGAFDICKAGDRIYIGAWGAGVFITEIEDGKIRVLGNFRDEKGESLGVFAKNDYLFVADNFEFEVLDVSNPAEPEKIANVDKLFGLHDLYVVDDYIYLADASKGMIVLQFLN